MSCRVSGCRRVGHVTRTGKECSNAGLHRVCSCRAQIAVDGPVADASAFQYVALAGIHVSRDIDLSCRVSWLQMSWVSYKQGCVSNVAMLVCTEFTLDPVV